MGADAIVAIDVEEHGEPETKASHEKTVMVSARIPVNLCNRVKDILKKQGMTQTDLIVAAFTYLYETGQLPVNPQQAQRGKHGHAPSPGEIAEFKQHMRSISCTLRPECEGWDADRMRFEAVRERYPEYLGNIGYEEAS